MVLVAVVLICSGSWSRGSGCDSNGSSGYGSSSNLVLIVVVMMV